MQTNRREDHTILHTPGGEVVTVQQFNLPDRSKNDIVFSHTAKMLVKHITPTGAKYVWCAVDIVTKKIDLTNKSSAVAEMGDRSHNIHRPKRGWGCCVPFCRGSWVPA